MRERIPPSSSFPDLLAISVGNSTTRFGLFPGSQAPSNVDGEQSAGLSCASGRISNSEDERLIDAIEHAAGHLGRDEEGLIVVASVNHPRRDELIRALRPRVSQTIYSIPEDLEIPLEKDLDPESLVGQDRLLNALAAYDMLQQACVVIDCGTAMTIDFVDGTGVFQGGAIAPGARLWLGSLHEGTWALPQVQPARPSPGAFGKNTSQAMLRGMYFGMRGMARCLVEHYAQAYGAYPRVIATGGDAELLLGEEELVDRIVPDLTLRGIAAACRRTLAEDHRA